MNNIKDLAGYIDHTLLKADATEEQIINLCDEAVRYGFASVCVNTCYARLAASRLKKSNVKVCCVVGFPLGATSTRSKVYETTDAVDNGAREIDMVINVGQLKSGNTDYVRDDIAAVVKAAHDRAIVKVIIEACLLSDEEKVCVCRIAQQAGADYVKTSTGFSTGGATVEDIKLMRDTVGPDMGVKAAGGIRSYETAIAMIEAGATRIGASNGISIVEEKF